MSRKTPIQTCDLCGARLRLRTVAEGPHEGAEFFACPNNTHDPKTRTLIEGACPMAGSFRGDWRTAEARRARSRIEVPVFA